MKGEVAAQKYFQRKLMADLARVYSPNDDITFFSASMPLRYTGDNMVLNDDIKKKW
jgi:hypothetical protein